MGVERSAPHFPREFPSGNVNVGYLSNGMNTGVRATGAVNLGRRAQNLLECCNQVVLHRITVRLALPTRKSSAVVGDGESQSFTGRNSLLHNAIKNVFWPRSWLRKLTALFSGLALVGRSRFNCMAPDFVLRPVGEHDLPGLRHLADVIQDGLTTLPPEDSALEDRIDQSLRAFDRRIKKAGRAHYLFLL